jgi:hypothetical protein
VVRRCAQFGAHPGFDGVYVRLRRRSTIKIMMYSASREDLKTVLEWLRGSDES